MFKNKNNKNDKNTINKYDKENFKAVLRCSICTGEQVAGFKNIKTGKFEDIMLIRDDKDLQKFLKTYDLSSVEKEY